MIDFTNIKRATADLFGRLIDLPPNQIRWEDEPEANAWTNDPMMRLNIKALASIGCEEEQRADDGVNDGIVTIVGVRMFTLTVKIESMTQRLQDPKNALQLASTLVTRLGRTSSVEALNDYYGVTDYSNIAYAPYVDSDGRKVNRYVIDFFCETEDNDVDGTPGAGGWIEEVIGSGTVTEGSTVVAVPFDVKD